MKELKFKPHLVDLMKEGKKRTTWRLFDDKDLTVRDELEFINSETGEVFGDGEILNMSVKTLGTLSDDDWEGHEKFNSDQEMYDNYKLYYPGEEINENTEVKIIKFSFNERT